MFSGDSEEEARIKLRPQRLSEVMTAPTKPLMEGYRRKKKNKRSKTADLSAFGHWGSSFIKLFAESHPGKSEVKSQTENVMVYSVFYVESLR